MEFSEVIQKVLTDKGKSLVWLSKKMGLSYQYLWKLINKKENKRWNEESINKACEVLGLKIEIK